MQYRGRMEGGVVVLEGEKPADGVWVDVTPAITPAIAPGKSIADHAALGIWKDRADLPDDAAGASKTLRERLMRRTDATDP